MEKLSKKRKSNAVVEAGIDITGPSIRSTDWRGFHGNEDGLDVPSDNEADDDPKNDKESSDEEADSFPELDDDDSEEEDDKDDNDPNDDEDASESSSSGTSLEDQDTREPGPFPLPKVVISDITGEPKRVYPPIDPEYDSDSSTEDVRLPS